MPRKNIDDDKITTLLADFEKEVSASRSIQKYIEANYELLNRLKQSGRTLRQIHVYLHAHGVDAGDYRYFCSVYAQTRKKNERMSRQPRTYQQAAALPSLPKSAAVPTKITIKEREERSQAEYVKRDENKGEMKNEIATTALSSNSNEGKGKTKSKITTTLPDGTPGYIDPGSGGKKFSIISER